MPISSHLPELSTLDVLVSVARLGSMGAAGREHGLSQQAVSARVRAAERQLGMRVFNRATTGVTPTYEGGLVLEWASSMLAAAEEFGAGVAALRGELDANLTVAASMTIAEYLVPGWTVTMRRKHPAVVTSVRLVNSADVSAQVLSGAADLGFIEGPGAPAGLRAVEVARDELLVVVPPTHPWATSGPIAPAELARTPMIARESGSGTRATLESALRGCVAPVLELTSSTAVKAAVVASNTPAVVSSLAVAADLAAGRLVSVEVDGLRLPRRLLAVWPATSGLRGVARDFVEIAGNVSGMIPASGPSTA